MTDNDSLGMAVEEIYSMIKENKREKYCKKTGRRLEDFDKKTLEKNNKKYDEGIKKWKSRMQELADDLGIDADEIHKEIMIRDMLERAVDPRLINQLKTMP